MNRDEEFIKNHHKKTASRLSFEMWHNYLTELNTRWDLEHLTATHTEEDQSDAKPSHFRNTLWDQHLLTLNQQWHVPSTLPVEPPASLPGKLLFPLKKLILRWIQPSIDALFERQNAYNAKVVQLCNGLVEAVNTEAVHKLDAQKDVNGKLVQALNGLVRLIDEEFQPLVWTFDARKEALEIEQMTFNTKLEQVLALLRELQQTDETSPLSGQDAHAPQLTLTEEETHAPELPASERQEDYSYFVFEHRFRGDEATIKQRLQKYIPYFQGCRNVLDLGCGRGEFLELLREHQIEGHGIDTNQMMIETCRKKDLQVYEEDVMDHLRSLPDYSLDGIFSAQMVEHYSPGVLKHLLQCCFEKLQSQKFLVIETQNPQSLYALSHFYRDMSHVKPVHPDALTFLLKSTGFQDIRIEYSVPFSSGKLLRELDFSSLTDDALREQLDALNSNIRQLNEFLYGHLDYAVIARKVKIF